jgi:hypothetical protein
MFVKAYRYRVQADKAEEYLTIQERAGQIYKKHVRYRSVYLRSEDDPGLWMEIHWYTDEKTYRRAMDLINCEPAINQLWLELKAVLDPDDPEIHEEYYEQIRSEDSLK